jgi:predicted RNA-binding Zn-ribbon protein involved in translation (DUF1610 family)
MKEEERKTDLGGEQSEESASPSTAKPVEPVCPECGMLLVTNGTGYRCENCGWTSGSS